MNYSKLHLTILFLAITTGFSSLNSCSKDKIPAPGLTINGASQVRLASESTMKFKLTLDKPSTVTVSADYNLLDGTAVSPDNYASLSGTISFTPGETEKTVDVVIKGDPMNTRQKNLQFTIQLSNPVYCTLANTSATGTIITQDGTYLPTDNSGYTSPDTYPGYTLAWSDEFSGSSLDLNSWNQEKGNGNGGWGNNELEYYTDNTKNTFLSNGNLIIEARRETTGNYDYTSGRMTTKTKKYFKFGRIDIRAKLPVGKGIWPALWMLGINIPSAGWPACGEIDIMELVGTYPNQVSEPCTGKLQVVQVQMKAGLSFNIR